jgi:hypothetical protein
MACSWAKLMCRPWLASVTMADVAGVLEGLVLVPPPGGDGPLPPDVPVADLAVAGTYLIPLTDAVRARCHQAAGDTAVADGFYELTRGVARWAQELSRDWMVLYVYCEFWAGDGIHAPHGLGTGDRSSSDPGSPAAAGRPRTRLIRPLTGPIWRSTLGCGRWVFTPRAAPTNSPPSAWAGTGGPPNGKASRAALAPRTSTLSAACEYVRRSASAAPFCAVARYSAIINCGAQIRPLLAGLSAALGCLRHGVADRHDLTSNNFPCSVAFPGIALRNVLSRTSGGCSQGPYSPGILFKFYSVVPQY